MIRTSRPMRRGLTLLEFAVAAGLAALLTVALTGVAAGFARGRARLPVAGSDPDPLRQLAARLEWDFLHAREVRRLPQGIALRGSGNLGATDVLEQGRPTEVVYRIESRGDRTCLVRKQIAVGAGRPGANRVDEAAFDVGSLDWAAETDASPPGSPPPGRTEWAAVPKRSRLRLFAADRKTVVLDTAILLP